MAETTAAAQMARLMDSVFSGANRALSDLGTEELHDTFDGRTNSIGFDIWHPLRTIDNVIHFAFEREQPVWLAQGFQEKWGLPRIEQGTGMDPAVALVLRFPEPEEFKRYVAAVAASVVPRIAAMTDEYLFSTTRLVPHGEIPRIQAIGQVLIAHANGHLGRIDLALTLLGKRGVGF